jgi:arylsulfatase A-like enzyme
MLPSKKYNVFFLFFMPFVIIISGCTRPSEAPDKPNILWLVSEDNSPLLGSYGDEFASTPRLDHFASEGVLYTHAFANAPVCAPARSTIISGMYANSLGTEHMRSNYSIPEFVKFFPQYLRAAGYYCTNNSKEDYNMPKPDSVWHESSRKAHYKNRPDDKPFFAIFNFGVSHESSLHTYDSVTVHEPDKVSLPPYHPDTEEIRHDWAQYYDRVSMLDSIVGNYLDSLESQGLAENTIVFYYSDHGGVLARSKRFVYETGTHVPFIVRFPEKYRHLAPSEAGSRSDRIISFVDLAPTLLSLVGIDVPEYMQGNSFLGDQKTEAPKHAYLFRGRMDERYDMMRAVRTEKFRYIRNFMPFRPWGQHLEYLWKAPATQSWEEEYRTGRTDKAQSIFWEVKPTEELYDVENDPYEVHNLAGDPEHKQTLTEMRKACLTHSRKIKDVGFIPEGQYAQRFGDKPAYEVLRNGDIPLDHIIETADLATIGNSENIPVIIQRLDDPDPSVRYWAATGCIIHGREASEATNQLFNLLEDPSHTVRIAAAEALYNINQANEAITTLLKTLDNENPKVQLHAINTLQMIRNVTPEVKNKMKFLMEHGSDKYIQRAAKYFLESLT